MARLLNDSMDLLSEAVKTFQYCDMSQLFANIRHDHAVLVATSVYGLALIVMVGYAFFLHHYLIVSRSLSISKLREKFRRKKKRK